MSVYTAPIRPRRRRTPPGIVRLEPTAVSTLVPVNPYPWLEAHIARIDDRAGRRWLWALDNMNCDTSGPLVNNEVPFAMSHPIAYWC